MRWSLLCCCALLTACGDDGGTCPEPQPLELHQSGAYSAKAGGPIDYYCNPNLGEKCGFVFQPHDGASPLQMDLDLEVKTVVISYTRGGKAIQERWRIAKRVN